MQSPYHPYVVTFLLAPNLFAPQAMCVFYAPKDDMCVGVWVCVCDSDGNGDSDYTSSSIIFVPL